MDSNTAIPFKASENANSLQRTTLLDTEGFFQCPGISFIGGNDNFNNTLWEQTQIQID